MQRTSADHAGSVIAAVVSVSPVELILWAVFSWCLDLAGFYNSFLLSSTGLRDLVEISNLGSIMFLIIF